MEGIYEGGSKLCSYNKELRLIERFIIQPGIKILAQSKEHLLMVLYKYHGQPFLGHVAHIIGLLCIYFRHFCVSGLNKHFHMVCVQHKLHQSCGITLTTDQIWDHLRSLYDLESLVSYADIHVICLTEL